MMCESPSCATETMTTACPATGAGTNSQPMDSMDTLSNHLTTVSSNEEPVVSEVENSNQGEATMNGVQNADQTHATGLTDGGTNNTTCAATNNLIYKQNHSPPASQTSAGSSHNGNTSKRGESSPPLFNNNADTGYGSRDGSPQGSAASGSPHVVHVHINPGEMFSVRMGDQMQHIQGAPLPYIPGPATVRMVSNNGPPLPMPMQVPPGHMVQQIVDENGILTHVILSPQPTAPPGMGPATMTGGPNPPPQQLYSPYNQYSYAAAAPSGYNTHTHHHTATTPPHIHVPQPPIHSPQQGHSNPNQQNHCPSHGHTQGHVNHNHTHMDERAQRQKQKLQNRLASRHKDVTYPKYRDKMNGVGVRGNPSRTEPNHRETNHKQSPASTPPEDPNKQEIEEEKNILQKLLSNMEKPKVSEVDSRSALIHLLPPECNHTEFDIDPGEFKFELLLSEKGEGKYKIVYSGDATEITLKDLTPATEYHLKVCALLDDLRGDLTSSSTFTTLSCEPEKPASAKLVTRTKTALTLKWTSAESNGSKITSYVLEWDEGNNGQSFTELYTGVQRQYKVQKLNTSTAYRFRLYCTNSLGRSPMSDVAGFLTSGTTPSQPDPPMLSERFVTGLCISWIRRPNDDNFVLQMEDSETGHGFLPVYNGTDLSYHITNLRRNTKYKYRLNAANEEGSSRWSECVSYSTLPAAPAPPSRPKVKGQIHAKHFKVTWDAPKDTGGAEISKYILQLGDNNGFTEIFSGCELEHVINNLEPGTTYSVRVSCESDGGFSKWSDVGSVTTLPVTPGICQSPKLKGKPKANSLCLQWSAPEYNGGAAITQYEVSMDDPESVTTTVYKGAQQECGVSSLLPGRTYRFKTKAFNKQGSGPWSEEVSLVSGAAVPDAPVMPCVHCKSPHSCAISWKAPEANGAAVTDYNLEWQPQEDFLQLYSGAALQFEAKGLSPASVYNFRVQAINSAGMGAFSPIASVCTPAAVPGAVLSIRSTPQITALYLVWKEPINNGSEILSYNIEINNEEPLIPVDNVLEYTVEQLKPNTTYKVRVQAVNGVGCGAFSTAVKMSTLPLPPSPPTIECVGAAHHNIKLKWSDGHKNSELIQYTLEMSKGPDDDFSICYRGSNTTFKLSKLNELTSYYFRIHATNNTGDGPLSPVQHFTTAKSPPATVKTLSVSSITKDGCTLAWSPCKPTGTDTIAYLLQINENDTDYKQCYQGPDCKFRLEGLEPKTKCFVRVCAIRQSHDGSKDLPGNYSMTTVFTTSEEKVANNVAYGTEDGRNSVQLLDNKRPITDQQWALIIILGFFVISACVAYAAQQFIS